MVLAPLLRRALVTQEITPVLVSFQTLSGIVIELSLTYEPAMVYEATLSRACHMRRITNSYNAIPIS